MCRQSLEAQSVEAESVEAQLTPGFQWRSVDQCRVPQRPWRLVRDGKNQHELE
jgi:hypothetical protein